MTVLQPIAVRDVPGGTNLGSHNTGELGTVIGGPTSLVGFTWWNINYDTGIDGWSTQEGYLAKSTTTPTPTPTPVDTTPPVISGVSVTNITPFAADVNWTTNEPADGQVSFCTSLLSACTNNTPVVSVLTTNHVINLSGLVPKTAYYITIKSKDASGNLRTMTSSFTTLTSITPTPTPTPPSGINATFRASADKRYLVNQNNQPVFLVGDSPHGLFANITPTQAQTYFANRASYGINVVWAELLCTDYLPNCRSNLSTFDGILPFSTPGDISTPNPAYFSRVDAIVTAAAQNGVTILMDNWETGAGMPLLRSNGNTKAFNYGVFLGNRYKNSPNIIWILGNDFWTWQDSTDITLAKNIMAGIASVDTNHLQTTQLGTPSGSHESTVLMQYTTLAAAYTYPPQYAEIYTEYNASPTLPVFMEEANYEGENNTGNDPSTPLVLRKQEYWSMLAGALAGQMYGNGAVDYFKAGWQTAMDTIGVKQLQYMKNFFASRQWYNLVPDQNHTVVTAGYGTFASSGAVTGNTYVTTARTTDGSLVISYIPQGGTITVDMTKLRGSITARWFDPTNNTFSTISGSPFANTGTRQFVTPGNNSGGDNDWVLVLDAP